MTSDPGYETRTGDRSLGTNRHHVALDGLRGWAALAVVLYHCILFYGPELTQIMIQNPTELADFRQGAEWLILNGANGSFAVTIFFILSGLVLAQSLRRNAGEPAIVLCLSFTIRRVIRLMPPLIVCVIFAFIVGQALAKFGIDASRQKSLVDLIENVLLRSFQINGATWTIQVEMLAIPFILTIFLLQRAGGPVLAFISFVAAVQIVPLTSLFGGVFI